MKTGSGRFFFLKVSFQTFTTLIRLFLPSNYLAVWRGKKKIKSSLSAWNCCAGVSQSACSPVAHLLGDNKIHVVLILCMKSQIKPYPCTLLRELLFSFYFQFHSLPDISTGIVLTLIYTLLANPRTSSSQKWHPKSHFLFNIITLMIMCGIVKVAHVISLFINHYSSASTCTAVTSSTFSHLQWPFTGALAEQLRLHFLWIMGQMALSLIFLTSGCP